MSDAIRGRAQKRLADLEVPSALPRSLLDRPNLREPRDTLRRYRMQLECTIDMQYDHRLALRGVRLCGTDGAYDGRVRTVCGTDVAHTGERC
eukprot:1334471-Rhodomonas_salina.2